MADHLVAGFEADIRQNQAPSRIQPPTSCGVPAAEAGANAHAALHKEEARTHEGTAASAHPNAALAAGTLELDPPFVASGIDNDDDEQGMEMEMELHPAAQRAHDERTAHEALEVDRAKRAVSIKRVAHICAVEDGVAEAALEDTDFDLERAVSALLDRAAAPPHRRLRHRIHRQTAPLPPLLPLLHRLRLPPLPQVDQHCHAGATSEATYYACKCSRGRPWHFSISSGATGSGATAVAPSSAAPSASARPLRMGVVATLESNWRPHLPLPRPIRP